MRTIHSRNIYSRDFKELAQGILIIDAFSVLLLWGYNGFILGDCFIRRHTLLQTYLFYIVVLFLLIMTSILSVIDYRHLVAESLTIRRWWKLLFILLCPALSSILAILITLFNP